MKGIVFCEFLEMVDSTFSPEMTETLIDKCDLPSGGAYTAVGTYNHDEIITLVGALSKETGAPVPDLVKAFGVHLFGRFLVLYPDFFDGVNDIYDFLESVDAKIHVDVRKLYPDAELPKIECERPSDAEMILNYESGRAMGDLAEGLIESAIKHFEQPVAMTREDLSSGGNQRLRFSLTKTGI